MAHRVRNFVFTLHNYTEDDIKTLLVLKKGMRYIHFGEELTKKNIRHLQGFICFNNVKTNLQMIKWFKKTLKKPISFCEEMRGSIEQNHIYTKKDGIIHKNGDPPLSTNKGKRTDLIKMREKLEKGEKMKNIIKTSKTLNYQQLRGLQILNPFYQKKRTIKPMVFWLYGSTGIGKSYQVYKTHDIEEIYNKDETNWWEGYNQEKILLIDDFRGNIKYNVLLKILDRYPYRVNIKGTSGQLNSPIIYITSSLTPEQVYHNIHRNDKIDQLYRRIDKVINMDLNKEIRDFNKNTLKNI